MAAHETNPDAPRPGTSPAPALLHIHLLGHFLVLAEDDLITGINSERVQELLAYLVLHQWQPHSRRHLAFLLWPDSTEPQARATLRNLVHQLRTALPPADRFVRVDSQTL